MESRFSPDPVRYQRMNTAELRQHFLVEDLFVPGKIQLLYWHTDRMVIGSAIPTSSPLSLEAEPELAANYFTQRRELGVFNIGSQGKVSVDGQDYILSNKDILYIGRGNQSIEFASPDPDDPARFFLASLPAHKHYPTQHATMAEANTVPLGSQEQASQRTIYQYIHPGGIQSCQLVMGFTRLATGNVWNTMPGHTHARRCEVYMYFDLSEADVVFHFMGPVQETRCIVVRDGQAVLSPSWSMHAGAGTRSYSFVWAMGGENQDFGDMDLVGLGELA